MNWQPMTIWQQNRNGLNVPTPEILSACWVNQVIGLVLPPLAAAMRATLRATLIDDGTDRRVAVAVAVCVVTGELPSAWEVMTADVYQVDIPSGGVALIPVPLMGMMAEGPWGLRIQAIEYRGDNLQVARDGVALAVEFEPGEPEVTGPYADILNVIGAVTGDRIQVMVRTDSADARRVYVDVDEVGRRWVAMVADTGTVLVTYQGELD